MVRLHPEPLSSNTKAREASMSRTITTWIAQCAICGHGIHGADVIEDGQTTRRCEHNEPMSMYEPQPHGSGPAEGTLQMVEEIHL